MSSKILPTGTSKEMHFVKISQKDGALTPPKAMEGTGPYSYFYNVYMQFCFLTLPLRASGERPTWEFQSQVLFSGIARENLDIRLL